MPPAASMGAISVVELELTTASLYTPCSPLRNPSSDGSNGGNCAMRAWNNFFFAGYSAQSSSHLRGGSERAAIDAQHFAIIHPDAVPAVVFPLQGDAKGRQHFRPAGAVDRLAVQKDPVEIEQDGFEFRHFPAYHAPPGVV